MNMQNWDTSPTKLVSSLNPTEMTYEKLTTGLAEHQPTIKQMAYPTRQMQISPVLGLLSW